MVDQVECGTWHASGVDFLKMTHTENAPTKTLESCQSLEPRAREKIARVQACEVSVLFTLTVTRESPMPVRETLRKQFKTIDPPPFFEKPTRCL